MSRFDTEFDAFLETAAKSGRRRTMRSVTPSSGLRVEREGRRLINFSGNDYLGLSTHPLLIERSREWASKYGAGSGASRLVTGTFDLHQAVEEKLARFKGSEAALLLASGWQANAGIVPAVVKALSGQVRILGDRLNHASLHHGSAASGVKQVRFRHNDLQHLEQLLIVAKDEGVRPLILTESVFSMDGDQADVDAMVRLADRYGAFLYLDDAHATGVLGVGGRGLASGSGVDLVMGTFSKALGGFGAYAAGSRTLCDYLVNACSSFIYSTALPPSVLGAIDAALDLVLEMDAERSRLARYSHEVRTRFHAAGIDTATSTTQIVPAIVGDAEAALQLSRALENAGILATAIRPPTVPSGTSRIRLTLSAGHSENDVDQMIETVIKLWPESEKGL